MRITCNDQKKTIITCMPVFYDVMDLDHLDLPSVIDEQGVDNSNSLQCVYYLYSECSNTSIFDINQFLFAEILPICA